MSTDLTLDLSIFDRSYKLMCPAASADELRAAARHVDQKMRELRTQLPRVEGERLAVMVALELCQALMQANRDLQQQAACQRLINEMLSEARQAVALR